MEWRLFLASLLICAATGTAMATSTATTTTTTEEPSEMTTSRLHRSTFQEQLQWTTPVPTTESLPADSETTAKPPVAAAAAISSVSELESPTSAAAVSSSLHSTAAEKSDVDLAKAGADSNSDSSSDVPAPSSLKAESESAVRAGDQRAVAHTVPDEAALEGKQSSNQPRQTQTKPQQTSSVDETGVFSENVQPIFSRLAAGNQEASLGSSGAAFLPAAEKPSVSDAKLLNAAERSSPIDEGLTSTERLTSTEAGGSKTQATVMSQQAATMTDTTSSDVDATFGDTDSLPANVQASNSVPVASGSSVSDADADADTDADADADDKAGLAVVSPSESVTRAADANVRIADSTDVAKQPNVSPVSEEPGSSRGNATTRVEQATLKQNAERKLANDSEPGSLAEVTPEPKLNEVKLGLNASDKEDNASVEELPALSMMALKAAPLVEFSYKEGTPKPPAQQNNVIQREPAKPIGEITEDDHVVGNSQPTIGAPENSEPLQPEGVLEFVRKVTKMLEDKYTAEESRTHRRVGNVSLPNLPIVVQRLTTPRPHRVDPSAPLDYDYPSIELMRLRAKEHNRKDLDMEASGRNQETQPRTSKIMNTAASNKDKMIFIKTVPKGSLTTVDPAAMTTASPVTVSATGSALTAAAEVEPTDARAAAPVSTATAAAAANKTSTTANATRSSMTNAADAAAATTTSTSTTTIATSASNRTGTTNVTTTTTAAAAVDAANQTAAIRPSPDTISSDPSDATHANKSAPTTQATLDDDYYDEPTELVDEEDVVSGPEKLPQGAPPQVAEPKKPVEDRPVMALVVQNPPNENSFTRKELKPLDTKDVQVSFILPAVGEPPLVPHKTQVKETPSTSYDQPQELSTESSKSFTESSYETKFAKPYPMQRVTTASTGFADDRVDLAPTANPMTTLAGGESSSDTGEYKLECPSREDIHPCTCVTHEDDYDAQIETAATCRGIKHSATLIEALRGFRGHHLTYLIIDNSDLPPFPNNILHRIQVDWMEVLNTPVQFKREYLQCSIKCTLS